jgi:hypothetical protein
MNQEVHEMAETKTARKGYLKSLSTQLEKGAEDVMKVWKTGAKRPDRIGDVSYRTLQLLHSGVGTAARELGRLEKATVPPARQATHAPAEPHKGGEPHGGARAHPAPRHPAVAEKTTTGTTAS